MFKRRSSTPTDRRPEAAADPAPARPTSTLVGAAAEAARSGFTRAAEPSEPQVPAGEAVMSSPKQPSPPSMRAADLPRRPTDLPTAPARRPPPAQSPVVEAEAPPKPAAAETPARASEVERKLIVGKHISLSGEISQCEYLVVEGQVEARVHDGDQLEITEDGVFRGSVEVVDADIRGRLEGEMTVSGRLTIRSTGRIVGKVEYGELSVEPGGVIEGEIHGIARLRPVDKPEAAPTAVAAKPAEQPRVDAAATGGAD